MPDGKERVAGNCVLRVILRAFGKAKAKIEGGRP
jgi:hypothetical protein